MALVEARLVALFGPFAGWAQTALFIAELRGQREALPAHLRTPAGRAPSSGGGSAAAARKKVKKEEVEGGEVAVVPRAPKKARAKGADAKPAAKRRLEAEEAAPAA
jgi:hypothetical protein